MEAEALTIADLDPVAMTPMEGEKSTVILPAATIPLDEHPLRDADATSEITRTSNAPAAPKSDLAQGPVPSAPSLRVEPPKRIIVGDASGRAIVSRFYARGQGRVVVQLPDGSLGWASGEVETDAPFVPWTLAEVREALLQGPYQGFQAIEEEHYLILYQEDARRRLESEDEAEQRRRTSETFARQSARLLENLLGQLLDRLRKLEFEVQEPEFPLVAVIFRDEDAFQDHRPVEADVRAYYEIYSNRIFLYETSDRDRQAPDLAALRRPQVIAHEGTHQILQNIGVQPRLAAWPAWLVEGLAEYCAPASARAGWEEPRFGKVNPFHMATLIDLQDPHTLRDHLQSAGIEAPAWIGPGRSSPWIEHLVTCQELTPTDYSLAWALTHYLMIRRSEALLNYLKTMGALPPLETRTGEQHLADFWAAFGADLKAVDRQVHKHLARLEYERVPFYAVLLEQAMIPGMVRREGFVTQSIPMIYHWVNVRTSRDAGPLQWRAIPHSSRNQARQMTQAWTNLP
ncbi:DUF1570 domain-containing protein [soil metagenome]